MHRLFVDTTDLLSRLARITIEEILIRDWEFLFWAFLVFGLGRPVWLYLYWPSTLPFISVSLAGSCSAAPCTF